MSWQDERREAEATLERMRPDLRGPSPSGCSAGDLKKALQDARQNGLPPTPARWQRMWRWGYCQSHDALERVRARMTGPQNDQHKRLPGSFGNPT